MARNKDLHAYELSEADWTLIDLVSSWLKSFRSATMQMSTTKVPMVTTTHAIFWGLQEDIKGILHSLPATVYFYIKHGLIDAHTKLSDYYHKYDESPFYTWAACMWFIWLLHGSTDSVLVLDPHISYEGMKLDYAGDESLAEYLESSKTNLYNCYETHYTGKHSAPSQMTDPVPGPSVNPLAPPHSPQKDFTSRFQQKAKAAINELDKFFNLP
jgi:hypothetical protein